MLRVSEEGLDDALARISPEFINSPQFECLSLNRALACSVVLKIETMNPIRCFKGRGIETTLSRYSEQGDLRTLICASAGNLGLALAYCGARRVLKVIVYASQNASQVKINRMREMGAEVRLVAGDFELALSEARRFANERKLFLIEDSHELGTCEGAGTIGLELVKYPQQIDSLLVALGGGALASGLGCAFKARSSSTQVIGVQAIGAAAMAESWRRRKVVETESTDTIADGVAVRKPIQAVLDDLLVLMDDALTVSEESIKMGMRLLYEHVGLVVEPSAALGIAAVLENRERFASQRVATVICGANVDLLQFNKLLRT